MIEELYERAKLRGKLTRGICGVLVLVVITSFTFPRDADAQVPPDSWQGSMWGDSIVCADEASCYSAVGAVHIAHPEQFQPQYVRTSCSGSQFDPYLASGDWYVNVQIVCQTPSGPQNDGAILYIFDWPSECDQGPNPPACLSDNVVDVAEQQCPTVKVDESDPCDPATGNKSQKETDYRGAGDGGLSFSRYYNSKGSRRTAEGMAPGWRHTYSRSLREGPDLDPLQVFVPSDTQSSAHTTRAEACTGGWDEIKLTAFAGDLSGATATFAGGDSCKIELGGTTRTYLSVRSNSGVSALPDLNFKTLTRHGAGVATYLFSFFA